MAVRFFYLPWRSSNRVGLTSRMAQANPAYVAYPRTTPGGPTLAFGNWDSNFFHHVDSEPMQSYGVTTDAARVPLVRTELSASSYLVSTGGNDDFPRYNPYSFNVTNCAYRYPGDNAWYGVINNYGPFFWAANWRPWAFFSYQLRGTSQILGSQFVANVAHPYPLYLRGRCLDNSIYTRLGITYSIGLHALVPMCCYVLRPSTDTIVGWLWNKQYHGGYGWEGVGKTARGTTVPNVPGPENRVYTTPYAPNYLAYGGNGMNVTGIQDGDLLVWEFWAYFQIGCSTNEQYYPASPGATVSMFVGGGTAGQPITLNAGDPNWAPSWGMSAGVVTGIEPNPPRQSQCSVGF